MKNFVELTSVNKEDLPTIYCDMDQVLVNLFKSAEKVLGYPLDSYKDSEQKEDRWKKINAVKNFWRDLEWMPGGKELWNYIAPYNPHILTAPMGYGSELGKQEWIDKNLNPPPPEKVFMSHDKYRWALTDGKPNVLIDDFKRNIDPWNDAGGIGILHTSVESTVAELEKLKEQIK